MVDTLPVTYLSKIDIFPKDQNATYIMRPVTVKGTLNPYYIYWSGTVASSWRQNDLGVSGDLIKLKEDKDYYWHTRT